MVMDSVKPPSRPRKIALKELTSEELVWEEFDAGMTAGPTDDEVEVTYTSNGDPVITVINRGNKTNSMNLDLDAMVDNWTEKDSARQAIMNARRKRNAELKEEALNKELRELNPDWGSW